MASGLIKLPVVALIFASVLKLTLMKTEGHTLSVCFKTIVSIWQSVQWTQTLQSDNLFSTIFPRCRFLSMKLKHNTSVIKVPNFGLQKVLILLISPKFLIKGFSNQSLKFQFLDWEHCKCFLPELCMYTKTTLLQRFSHQLDAAVCASKN